MDISKGVKLIISALGAAAILVSVPFFLDDRYENEIDAAETKMEVAGVKQVSQEQIETLESVQRSLQSMQRDFDLRALESLRNEKYLMKKQLDANPDNDLLKDRVERLQDKIEKLENKIYR